MNSGFYLNFTNKTSSSQDFTTTFTPALNIEGMEFALDNFQIPYSIYNISSAKNNNQFEYSSDGGSSWKTIIIPDGLWAMSKLNLYLHYVMKLNSDYTTSSGTDNFYIDISPNVDIGRMTITITDANYQVKTDNTAGLMVDMFGFTPNTTLTSTTGQYSDGINNAPNLAKVNNGIAHWRINCDLVNSSFVDGVRSQLLYTFAPTESPFSKIIRSLKNRYQQPNKTRVSSVRMYLTDDNGNIMDLHGEKVSYTLYFRPMVKKVQAQ